MIRIKSWRIVLFICISLLPHDQDMDHFDIFVIRIDINFE